MERTNILNHPIVTDFGITILRVFLGGALFTKGVYFMMNMQELQSFNITNMPFSDFLLAHFIVFAHLIGGLCLFLGLLTRVAAIFNIPIILGAIIFVHAKEGLFASDPGLELTIFLLVTLCVLALTGSKLFAMDNLIKPQSTSSDNVVSIEKLKHAA